jgi:hypothetical protein
MGKDKLATLGEKPHSLWRSRRYGGCKGTKRRGEHERRRAAADAENAASTAQAAQIENGGEEGQAFLYRQIRKSYCRIDDSFDGEIERL